MGEQIESETAKIRGYIDKIASSEQLTQVTYEVTSGSEAGDNYVGVLHRIVVTGLRPDGAKTTKSLIYKRQPDSEARRKQFRTDDFFNNEAVFYNHVLPSLVTFQTEAGLIEHDGFASYPTKCYHAGEALILEDMRPRGFVMRDRRVSLDGAHCLLVMRELGKFHAISFALRDQKEEEFKRLTGLLTETLFIAIGQGNSELQESLDEHANNLFTDAVAKFKETSHVTDKEKYTKQVTQFQRDYYKNMAEMSVAVSAEPYAVINHGDCWTNNILFKYAKDSSTPEQLCFLDFQIARYSSPVTDLSYFIFCCTDQETRKQHYDNWMTEYHQSLSQFLRQLGSDPDKLYPFAVFQDQLLKYSKFGLGMAVLTIPLFTSNAEDLPDLDQMSEEAAANNSQLMIITQNNTSWKRMNGVIEDMVDKGYL